MGLLVNLDRAVAQRSIDGLHHGNVPFLCLSPNPLGAEVVLHVVGGDNRRHHHGKDNSPFPFHWADSPLRTVSPGHILRDTRS